MIARRLRARRRRRSARSSSSRPAPPSRRPDRSRRATPRSPSRRRSTCSPRGRSRATPRPRSSTASSPRAPRASPTTSGRPGSTSRARPRPRGTRRPACSSSGPVEPAPTTTETEVTIDVPVVARVGESGRVRRGAAGRPRVRHVRDGPGTTPTSGGSPRTPPGLILQQEDFARLYRPASLYFLSPDKKFLVPEERWFPTKNLQHVHRPRAARRAVGLAAGRGARRPSPTASSSTRRPCPSTTTAWPRSAWSRALAVTRADRDLLIAQIDASLRPVPGISSVQVYARRRAARGLGEPGERLRSAGQRRVPAGRPPRRARRRRDQAGARPRTPLDGLDPRSPARNEDGSVRVMLSGAGTLTTVPTTRGRPAGALQRFGPGRTVGRPVRLGVDGAAVHRARRGAGRCTARAGHRRLARGSGGAGGPRGARRGPDRGRLRGRRRRPGRRRGDHARRVGCPAAARGPRSVPVRRWWTRRRWSGSDESTLAVVGRSVGNAAVHLVPVAGPTRALPEVANLADLAGSTVIYVTTTDGELRRFVGSTWAQIAGRDGCVVPVLPGLTSRPQPTGRPHGARTGSAPSARMLAPMTFLRELLGLLVPGRVRGLRDRRRRRGARRARAASRVRCGGARTALRGSTGWTVADRCRCGRSPTAPATSGAAVVAWKDRGRLDLTRPFAAALARRGRRAARRRRAPGRCWSCRARRRPRRADAGAATSSTRSRRASRTGSRAGVCPPRRRPCSSARGATTRSGSVPGSAARNLAGHVRVPARHVARLAGPGRPRRGRRADHRARRSRRAAPRSSAPVPGSSAP